MFAVCLHGVFLRPLARQLRVPFTISLVDARDLWHERVVRIRIAEQRADRQQYFGNGERRRPLRPENVQADTAVAVDVRMIDACRERHLGRLERVVCRKVNRQKEHTALVRRLGRAHDRRLPVE